MSKKEIVKEVIDIIKKHTYEKKYIECNVVETRLDISPAELIKEIEKTFGINDDLLNNE